MPIELLLVARALLLLLLMLALKLLHTSPVASCMRMARD